MARAVSLSLLSGSDALLEATDGLPPLLLACWPAAGLLQTY
jgi:hypothetical protein